MKLNLNNLLKRPAKSSASQGHYKTGPVEFNMLPDVKREYIKSQTAKNQIVTIATIVAGTFVLVVLLLALWVLIIQKKQLDDSASQISSTTNSIKTEPNIANIITVQNQLTSLASLHSNKHISSRIFGYLTQLTPANVGLSQLTLDFDTNSLTLDGTANSAAAVNQFIDTLKLASYTVGSGTAQAAFNSVVENSFSIGQGNVSYSIGAKVDPKLFANNLRDNSGSLVAPKLQVDSQSTNSGTIFNGAGQ